LPEGVAEKGVFVFCYADVANEHHGYKKITDTLFGKLARDFMRKTERGAK
jgi:hypothetical protein